MSGFSVLRNILISETLLLAERKFPITILIWSPLLLEPIVNGGLIGVYGVVVCLR